MRKITKMIMAATLGLAIASAALVFNPVKTEAKTTYVTTTTASKKIVALQKKAYKSKKKVSSKTFKFKAKSAGAFERERHTKKLLNYSMELLTEEKPLLFMDQEFSMLLQRVLILLR